MGNGTGPVPATVVDDGLGNTCYCSTSVTVGRWW